jgi:hypothetical protein
MSRSMSDTSEMNARGKPRRVIERSLGVGWIVVVIWGGWSAYRHWIRLPEKERTVLLGGVYNLNSRCVGHAAGLCGPEDQTIRSNFESAFATEPDCEELIVRGLNSEENKTPIRALKNYVSVNYVGKPHVDSYEGTGKDENGDWTFMVNGANGNINGQVGSEEEVVRRVCRAVRNRGGEVQK